MVFKLKQSKLLPRVLPIYKSLKPNSFSHLYEIKKKLQLQHKSAACMRERDIVHLHVWDNQVLDAPILEGAVWHVPPDNDRNLQRGDVNDEEMRLKKVWWLTFLIFSSFCAITSGSVSPSSSTMTGAHIAICRARVPRTRARSYLPISVRMSTRVDSAYFT